MQQLHPPLQRHSTPHKWMPFFALLLALAGGAILFLLAILFLTEQYFAPAPAIGTLFSRDYTEAAFNQIQPGMTEAEVVALLGNPLSNERMIMALGQGENMVRMPVHSNTMWEYSRDNPQGIWDFAWLGRFVYFDSEGRVTGTLKWVFYD